MDDYRRFTGARVNVRYRTAGSGPAAGAEAVVEGTLGQVDERALTVLARGGRDVVVPVAGVIAARLAVDFGGDDRPGRGGG